MAAHLGTFGAPKPEAEINEFDWFGKTIRTHPALGEMDLIEFLARAGGIDVNNVGSLGSVMTYAEAAIHPEDFDEFWSLGRANRQTSTELFEVLTAITEAVTDRPTEQQSASSDGPLQTFPSSEAESLSVQVDLETSGRGDLARVVQMTREGASA